MIIAFFYSYQAAVAQNPYKQTLVPLKHCWYPIFNSPSTFPPCKWKCVTCPSSSPRYPILCIQFLFLDISRHKARQGKERTNSTRLFQGFEFLTHCPGVERYSNLALVPSSSIRSNNINIPVLSQSISGFPFQSEQSGLCTHFTRISYSVCVYQRHISPFKNWTICHSTLSTSSCPFFVSASFFKFLSRGSRSFASST